MPRGKVRNTPSGIDIDAFVTSCPKDQLLDRCKDALSEINAVIRKVQEADPAALAAKTEAATAALIDRVKLSNNPAEAKRLLAEALANAMAELEND